MKIQERLSKLGRRTGILLVFGLLIAGVASGVLLEFFGTITGMVTVEQAIVLQGCTNNECSSTLGAIGSETAYSDEFLIESNTVNDLDVKFDNACSPDCEGITTTNMVKLSVVGFPSGGNAFASDYYKATNYFGPVNLADLDTVTYSFKITENTFTDDRLAPYLVISSPEMPYGAIVYLLPVTDGPTYSLDEVYTVTLDSTDVDTLFHVPGDVHGCAGQNPETSCTLDEIKAFYGEATITRVRLALGAWGDETKTITALAGIGTINGLQAEHKSVTMYGETTIPTIQKYDFAANIEPGIYTMTTTVGINQ